MKIEFKTHPNIDLRKINDSMELDSGTDLATLKITLGDGRAIKATLEVRGEVRVHYLGDIYTCASNMPKDLVELFHNGGWDPDDGSVIVDDNNWFEVFVEDGNGVIDSVLVDAEGLDELKLLTMMVEICAEVVKSVGNDADYALTIVEQHQYEGFHPAQNGTVIKRPIKK